MTVRELIVKLAEECPSRLDSDIYVQEATVDEYGDKEYKNYVIDKITNGGSNDAVFIEVKS